MTIQAPRLVVPRAALPYALLQRLELQHLGSRLNRTLAGQVAYHFYEKVPALRRLYRFLSTRLEPRLRPNEIASAYSNIMAREFETIRPHLPERIETVAGIGAGIAGLEAHLSSHLAQLGRERPEIFLVDKSGLGEVFYGYQETATAYNSLEVARELLTDNGHPQEQITLIDASAPEDIVLPDLDLVTSLIAWGFHFPVATYLDSVYVSLRNTGVLIMDVRKGTDGREVLSTRFKTVTVILDELRFERVLARK